MLTHADIDKAIKKMTDKYRLTSVRLFGSYANGTATEKSDVDLLVEFEDKKGGLRPVIGLKLDLEEELRVPVDVICGYRTEREVWLSRLEKDCRVAEYRCS